MRSRMLLQILACGMLACTPDPEKGEQNSGTVNIPGENDSPITRHDSIDIDDTGATTRNGGTSDQKMPQDNSQTNVGTKASGEAGE